MFGLLVVFVWSAFGTALQDGVYYDCALLSPSSTETNETKIGQAHIDCIATGWCLWKTANPNINTCVNDPCLKPIAHDDVSTAAQNCPQGTGMGTCALYYITDVRNCGTATNPGNGAQTDYDDVYCRLNDTGYDKQPLDKCFYDDLVSRFGGGSGTCGNRPCAWNGTSSTDAPGRFCRASDAAICTDVLGDMGAFCDCLGSTDNGKFCNLHPNCILNDANQCIEDLCTRAQNGLSASSCSPVPAAQDPSQCGGRWERRIDSSTGLLSTSAELKCANVNKNKNGNTCFWGIDSKITKWTVGTDVPPYECSTVSTVDFCTDLGVYNYTGGFSGALVGETKCEPATIPTGWFAGTTICIDPGRAVPSVDAGLRLNVPSMLAVLLVVAAFVGFVL